MKPNLLLAVALVVVSFSGCLADEGLGLSTNPTNTEEPASTVVVEPEKGVYVAENRGILRGLVVNDAGLGIRDARVSILGTDLFQATDARGTFQFDNLTVGEKVVRAELEGFQHAENTTTVRPGNITNITLLLLPNSDTGAGYRPHLHDYWGDATELKIMDDDVDLRKHTKSRGGAGGTQTQQAASAFTYSAQNSTGNMYRIPLPGDGDPLALIFPGTKEVTITITWTQQAFTGTKVMLAYRPPTSQPETLLARQGSGSTWKIPVTPDMWDTGHQWYSLWAFYVSTYQDPNADGTNFRPGIINGNFHVTVKLTKGELLAEPGHVNFWENGDTLSLHAHTGPAGVCDNAWHVVDREWPSCRVTPQHIVPPGTAKLRVEIKWTYGTYEGTPALDFIVVYRDASLNPWMTGTHEFKPATCTGTGQTRVCEIPVKASETDAYYQKRSTWAFTYAVKDHHTDSYDPEVRNLRFTMDILAYKDPTYGGAGGA